MKHWFPPRLPPMILFAVCALAPLPLLALGIWLGGPWAVLALVYMTALTALLDQIIPIITPEGIPDAAEFPAADALLVALALGHLVALPITVWAAAGDSGLSGWDRGLILAGAALWVGQVANPAAHELIHRGNRGLFRLGAAVYGSLLFGHHVSAHRLVHHRHAASAQDPNTARAGEAYYRFAARAWAGSYRAGMAAENARRAGGKAGLHPYAAYTGLAVASLALGWLVAGGWGLATWAALAALAQAQLLLADYVQHYGLTRATLPQGGLEPVSERHSWNAPHWFSAHLMLNAPRHSDHHAHHSRAYPALRLPGPDAAPRLPFALPVCCALATLPPLWRRVMHPRLKRWRRA